ncbi:MAG: quinone oxidoreductase [Rhodospirillaceae bacterium]|nr:MAG: quinone oxidoreductase [Rhodospirillaceae bacterium]
MKAQIIEATGAPSVFKLVDVPKPAVTPGHVLIRIAGTSVNPLDARLRRQGGPLLPKLPAILHLDFAGTVDEVGEGVTVFRAGDEVYGYAGGVGGIPGALAEYMLADARLIARKPATLTMAEAAALPVVAITAWEGLMTKARLMPGQTALIHAAAGGVGHVAVQIAKHLGAKVFATASTPEKCRLALSFGAQVAIDYRAQSVAEYVAAHTDGAGFDVVFDTVGGKNLDASMAAVAFNGQVVTAQARSTHDLTPLHSRGASLHAVFSVIPVITNLGRERQGRVLGEIAALVDSGAVRPLLDHTYSFDQVADAHARLESGQAIGKVVVTV